MKNRVTQKFVFIMLLFSGLYLFGQNNNTISGKVFDAKTKEPLPMVNVYLSGTLYGTTTDNNGNYKISLIPYGKYYLIVSIVGYEPQVVEVELKHSYTVETNFSLKEKVYEFKPVEVTAEVPEDWQDQLEFFKEKFLQSKYY